MAKKKPSLVRLALLLILLLCSIGFTLFALTDFRLNPDRGQTYQKLSQHWPILRMIEAYDSGEKTRSHHFEGKWRDNPSKWIGQGRQRLSQVLFGDQPPCRNVKAQPLFSKTYKDYKLEALRLTDECTGIETWTYVGVPLHVQPPYPIVLALHGHDSKWEHAFGRAEGFTAEPYNNFEEDFVKAGYVVIVPELVVHDSQNKFPLAGQRVWQAQMALDYAKTRTDGSLDRGIGCAGFDLGAFTTTALSALEPDRLSIVSISGWLRDWSGMTENDRCWYTPGLVSSFTAADILGLSAPRILVVQAPTKDALFPLKPLRKEYSHVVQIYAAFKKTNQMTLMMIPDHEHWFFAGAAIPRFDVLLKSKTALEASKKEKPSGS